MLTTHEAVKKLIAIAGGQSALARQQGVKQQTVFVWAKTGRVPAERVISLEVMSGGKVLRHEIRPDIYPPQAA